ncbi:MAG: UvrD-helicase domain-containing protein [bacterium]|nr:UvrD-helicase domain-containing protein [bacterium]
MYNLNKNQKKAVEHTGSPLLIIAGAGTGKTTVITQKIGWLIEQELAKPDEILALTFTEKAAGEMAERADKLLPYGYVDLWIMTFHGFCEKILQQHGFDIGLPTNFKLLNEFGQWALIKKNLDKFELDYYRPLGNPTKFISAMLKHFSRAKDEVITAKEYLEYAEELRQNLDGKTSTDKIRGRLKGVLDLDGKITHEVLEQEVSRINEVANAYHVYQQLLLDNNMLDFGDLINYTLKLFKERLAVLQKFQEKFKYILVDEFQDTNWAQYELVKLLTPQGKNLTVVGDDDQSIFRFRGTSMSNILQFKKDYKNSQEVVLTDNYRSAQSILDTAYEFIQLNNPNRLEVQLRAAHNAQRITNPIDKRLISQNKEAGTIEMIQGNDLQDEVNKVVEKIAELKVKDKDCTWNDFAILVRANSSAKEFTNALDIARLPYVFLSAQGLYSQPVIMDIISYLKLLDNYHEANAMYRVLNIPIFSLDHEEIMELLNGAKKKAWSLWQATKFAANFGKGVGQKVKSLIEIVQRQSALVKTKKASEIIFSFMNESGYLQYVSKLPEQDARDAARLLNAFMKRVKEFENDNPLASSGGASIKNFLAEIELEMESGNDGAIATDPEAGPEMIKIMTVHGAKGLEFKYVFIVNMVDLRFPTTERHDPIALPDALVKEILPQGDTHLEEERRLFYVAMTRAKKGLYFSWAPDYGGARKKKPSRFLIEAELIDDNIKEQALSVNAVKFKELTKQPAKAIAKHQYSLPAFYSFTQLQAFKNCPYQYRFAHVLKIPRQGKAPFSFGQTMHLTLQQFFTLMLTRGQKQQVSLFESKKKDEADKNNLVNLKELLALYDEYWIDDWYEDEQQKIKYQKKGRQILKDFYAKHADSWPQVELLEKGFRLRLGEYTMYGKVDRIDAGDKDEINIVDYKTGRPKQAGKVTAEDKEQLLIYQMAAQEVMKRKVGNLQFYYLDDNSEINFLGTPDEIIDMKEKIISRIKNIEAAIKNNEFPAKPSQLCKFCDFRDICEFRQL